MPLPGPVPLPRLPFLRERLRGRGELSSAPLQSTGDPSRVDLRVTKQPSPCGELWSDQLCFGSSPKGCRVLFCLCSGGVKASGRQEVAGWDGRGAVEPTSCPALLPGWERAPRAHPAGDTDSAGEVKFLLDSLALLSWGL